MTNGFIFHKIRSLQVLALVGAMAIIATAPSGAAPITFAQFVETNGAQDWTITESTVESVTTTTVAETGTVYFSFQGASVQPFGGAPQLADFTLTATSTSLGNCAVNCGGGFTQAGYSGTFSFTDATAGGLFVSNNPPAAASPHAHPPSPHP